ncbi:MAG: phosphatase PAP2 family protein [Gammaproteobacteria bacterium]|nr:phosphatase PAP2 family protein [Gammaproteobacteria bacterium]
MLEALKPAIEWLHFHPIIACVATFFIAFSESIAFIGLVIPGSVLLIGIGTLIGSGVITARETILAAIIGAILGDFLSFWIGHHYCGHIHDIWPFRRWPALLKKGEAFFHRHGGKGVFLGRFVGPVRPITPVIAGVMKMPFLNFALVDIFSALLWATAYMLPGIVLGGAASAELSHDAVPHFILIMLISTVTIALLYWFIVKIIQFFVRMYHHFQKHLWTYIQQTPRLSLLKKMVYTPFSEEREHQIDLLFLSLLSFLFFCFIVYEVMTGGWLTHYNPPLNYFFRSLRVLAIDKIMIPLTFLGEKRPMLALLIAVGAGLLWKRYYRTAFFWFLNGFLIFGLTSGVKLYLHVPRPLGIKGALEQGWSFPSGHTALSIALLGMMALMFSQHLPRLSRKYLYTFMFGLSALIALSRLYLGAHWLSDVLGGLCLGLFCLSSTALLYRHRKNQLRPRNIIFIVIIAAIAWLGVWSILLFKEERRAFEKYQLSWPKEIITLKEWQDQNGNNHSPLYRNDRFGKPVQTVNIQLLGNLNVLRSQLLRHGWLPLNESALKILFFRLSQQSNQIANLPFITRQYLGKAPLLTFYKIVDNNLLIARLWQSSIEILPQKTTILVGEVAYYHAWHPHLLRKHKKDKPVLLGSRNPLDVLETDLKHTSSLTVKVAHFEQYPPLNNALDQDWNGNVLLITTNKETAR